MAEIDKDTKEKIANLQILDQKLQSSLMRKQALQSQLLESENTLAEMKNDIKEVYKIVGNIMISADPTKVKKEIESSVEMIGLRLKEIEKNEDKLRKELETIQEEVMSKMKK